MILVTKNNVSPELLKKIIGGTAGRVRVEKAFLLQTSKGIHTALLCSRSRAGAGYMVKHMHNSPYAVIRKGSSSTYIGGTVTELTHCIKNEDYEFHIRGQSR